MDTARNRHPLGTLTRDEGLGLRYICSTYRKCCITSMHCTLCAHRDLFPFPLHKDVQRIQTQILAYISLLQSLEAIPGVSLLPMKRHPRGPDLFGNEERDNGRDLAAQQHTVEQRHVAIKYCTPCQMWRIQEHGDILAGCHKAKVVSFEVYINGRLLLGASWHSHVSKLQTVSGHKGTPQSSRAQSALMFGPL